MAQKFDANLEADQNAVYVPGRTPNDLSYVCTIHMVSHGVRYVFAAAYGATAGVAQSRAKRIVDLIKKERS